MTREKVIKELEIQESISEVENKDLILKILDSCKTSNEFLTFCDVKFHSYGKLSYEAHRFYSVKAHLLPLLQT
jgi:hypothetical protein